eukprot:CAMPEP_0181307726 /NCGR_PEP_ID=MMETSP1101-20121128/11051_1 /TAXON_ID=46948 /ORGANISM="Rhodomonas abbreviata, Strain Caron Lab Isolate" /LENGTH=121 /DNA_ID=CAMNT_0023413997 /DNA_START=134 /DNA_END=500 /DNA_ORIENTATION=+
MQRQKVAMSWKVGAEQQEWPCLGKLGRQQQQWVCQRQSEQAPTPFSMNKHPPPSHPPGTHVGSFFGTPLSELVQQRQNVATASTLDSGKHACAGAGNPFGELGDLFFAEKGESPRKQLENG